MASSTTKEVVKPKAAAKDEEQKYEVVLFVYDISQGMAKALSMGLVGKQLDGIWHTGLIVYGYEYYYGGGIQAALPGQTMAGKPMMTHKIGYTSLPQEVFHDYLRSISPRFTAATYSLLKWNCNNFTSECSKFLTGGDIPSYITGLPEEALNTPMGQMFKPFIMQMEAQMKGSIVPWQEGDGGGGGDNLQLPSIRTESYYAKLAPGFSYATGAALGSGSAGSASSSPHETKSAGASPSINDMAAMLGFGTPNSTQAASAALSGFSSAAAASSKPAADKSDSKETHAHASLKLTVLPTHSKVLLSEDKKHKSFQALIRAASKKLDRALALSEAEVGTLDALVTVMDSANSPMPSDAFALFERLVRDWPVGSLFSVLGLFRLFVLRPDVSAAYEDQFREVNKGLSDCLPSLARVLNLLNQASSASVSASASAAASSSSLASASAASDAALPNNARLMAYCTLSNLFARPSFAKLLACDSDILKACRGAIGAADETLSTMGANVLFNCCVYMPKDDCDSGIETVGYLAETIKACKQPSTALRLLFALGQLVYKNSGHSLLLTNGFDFDIEGVEGHLLAISPATSGQIAPLCQDLRTLLQFEADALS